MKKIKNYISKILILLGSILIVSAIYMKSTTEYQKNDLISDYRTSQEQLVQNVKEDNHISAKKWDVMEDKEDGNDSGVMSEKQSLERAKRIKTGDTIGIIQIPKINLETAVCEGVDKEIMHYAVGHFPETALPGRKGNFAVTGHRNYIFGEYFNRLDELEKGDLVKVERKTEIYVYEVTDKFVVEPDQLWVLDETEDVTITLITCTPIRIATHRLIVKGKLVEINEKNIRNS